MNSAAAKKRNIVFGLTGAGFVICALLIFLYLSRGPENIVAVTDLVDGQCLAEFYGDTSVAKVQIIECQMAHSQEVFSVNDLGLAGFDGYPSIEEIGEETRRICEPEFFTYTNVEYSESEYLIAALFPEEEAWELGDVSIVCVLGAANNEPLTTYLRVGS